MKKAEAESKIVSLWQAWPGREQPPSPGKGMLFYNWLSAEHPIVMDFRVHGDKWQVVSGWLNRHHLR